MDHPGRDRPPARYEMRVHRNESAQTCTNGRWLDSAIAIATRNVFVAK
jgi:hypothetical protein